MAEWADLFWMLAVAAAASLIGIYQHKLWWVYVLVALVVGFFYWDLVHPVCPSQLVDDQGLKTELVIIDNPAVRDRQLRFTARDRHSGECYRVVCRFERRLERGDLLKINGSLRMIEGPSNPGEFDFKEYFAHRGIFYNLIMDQPYELQQAGRKTNPLQDLFQGAVKRGMVAIDQNMSTQEAVLLAGMLFGFQGEISEEDFGLFQKTGLVHIFSVSGFHVGFVVLLGTILAEVLKLSKRSRLLFVSGLILLYGFLAAWPVPLIRAAIMAWMGLTALYLGREKDLLTSLAAAGIAILLMNPANLFEISFQLTFLATWGIIYLYPRWKDSTRKQSKWQDLLLLSLAPQTAVLPLAVYYYNMVSLISVLANLLLVNLAGGAVILGFIGIILAQISLPVAALFMIPAGFITKIVIVGVNLLAKVPGGYLWVAKPTMLFVVLAYIGILLLFRTLDPINGAASNEDCAGDKDTCVTDLDKHYASERWIKGIGYALVIVFTVRLLIPGEWRDPGRMKIVFLDVGQGDCIFIKTGRGSTILIDGGGSEYYDVGGKVVLPYLRREGIRKLDIAIATHPHVDHIKGLLKVLAECPAAVVLSGQHCFDGVDLREASVVEVNGSNKVLVDNSTELCSWSPDEILDSATAKTSAGNDISVISRIRMGETSFLFMGDAAKNELRRIDDMGLELTSTVVKVPHHGSKYSWYDPFWEGQDPLYAVVQVGARNTFGHPNPTVLERLQDKGIVVFRTDVNGAVTILTDGHKLEFQTMR